jgi:iron complex transport system ATP-binding protein
VSSVVVRMSTVGVVRGGEAILSGINWTVCADERWVVLGPNGAGKSTLIQVAASRLFPTQGTVELLGERLGAVDVAELRPRLGLASSTLASRVPEQERVLDVVVTASYGAVGRWTEHYEQLDLARAAGLLGQLGVAGLADRRFGTLSEGERQRVQIARALMSDPELLLLDEPTAGLDLGGREDLLSRLGTLADDHRGSALVMVTHHVEEIPLGVSHALLLRGGRITAAGPVGETLTNDALSSCFGLPLQVDWDNGRWRARALS